MATDVVEIVDLTGDTPQRKPSRISTAVQPNQTINEGQKPDAYHGIAGQRALPVFGRTTPIVNALFPESTLPPTAAEIPSSPPGVGHRILFGSVTPLANPLLGNNPLASCTAPRAARLTTGISQSQPVVKRQTLAELFRALDAQKTASLDQALVDLTPVDTPAQEQAQAREDNELVLFSDGSFLINAGRVGGCGVAFQARNGKWKGRAVALGVISGSEEAELYGIYEAFKMAADAMIGNARRLLVKTDHQGLLVTIGDARKAGNASGRRVLGLVLEEEARLAALGVEASLGWVKGHNTSAGNCVADALAGYGSKQSAAGAMAGSFYDNAESRILEGANKAARKAHKIMARRRT